MQQIKVDTQAIYFNCQILHMKSEFAFNTHDSVKEICKKFKQAFICLQWLLFNVQVGCDNIISAELKSVDTEGREQKKSYLEKIRLWHQPLIATPFSS